jgi:NADH-quinone oxidoreductase subunit L
MFQWVPLIILFPLLGLLINLFFGSRFRDREAGIIGSVAAGLAFVIAVLQAAALLNQPTGAVVPLANWIQVDQLNVSWAFQVDTLSATMMLIVTGVGTLIHIYAIGYMRGDERFSWFFVYMNLFLVAMLLLVTADNFLTLFVGWEGVGLCSFLLIGFWFDKAKGQGWKNSQAARKAFIVNRIGDFGLLLGVILIFWTFGTLNFNDVFQKAQETLTIGAPVATAITLLLLLGVTGKSAQIPLFIWLPDAMAGPTPVSALIHAATMVTAGIYLIARSHALFDLAPLSQQIVTLTGTATALLAATMAVAPFDIKRVLAYSTISQLGFMVAAVGMGAYVAGIFHLATHAFFKALLFLAAGSVIHGMQHGQDQTAGHGPFDLQDMRSMGGLYARMRVAFTVYVIGALALAGIPPLAGFFSKDEILAEAFAHYPIVFIVLTIAAFFTAFYMGRQIFMVFLGRARSQAAAHAAECPLVMTAPLVLLAALSFLGGAINLPGTNALAGWLGHTFGEIEVADFNVPVALASIGIAMLGLALAYLVYGRAPVKAGEADPLARILGSAFVAFNRKWWIDELYQWAFVRLFNRLGQFLARADDDVFRGFDRLMISLTQGAGAVLSKTQTGQLNWNALGIAAGLVIVLLVLVVGR